MQGVCSSLIRLALIVLAAVTVGCGKKDTPTNRDLVISNPSAKVAVVFIHGVMGLASTTFKRDSAAEGWPEFLARDTSIGVPVNAMSVGYLSEPLSRASNIAEIATRLQARLIDTGVFDQNEKVIFIAHSMGGLITKRLLLQMSRDSPAAFEKVASVFFLGVPAGGADLADLASWVSRNPQFHDMNSQDFNTFLQAEEDDWAALLRRRKAEVPYPVTYCIYEKLPLGPAIVVPRSRSQTGCDERPVAFDRNHLDLVKPADPSDEVYVYVVSRIRRIVRDEYLGLKVSARLLTPQGRVMPDSPRLRTGDQYTIQISSNKPAWFYVFSQDARGKVERYFPTKTAGVQASAAAFARIPDDPTKALTLDEHRGSERIVVFASLKSRADLAHIATEVEQDSANAPRVLDREVLKRGARVANVQPQRSDTAAHAELPVGAADAAVELRLWHE
jgi:pimeloyl-ACP methyl ester carboxylesterase